VWLSIEVSWSCPWAKISLSLLCDWATCNLRLHFSGTLLGSARRTGLLPVCGRNLYNCLCSYFLCSLLLSAAHDSELTQTLNYFRLWTWEQFFNIRNEKAFENTIQPPLLVFFSPSIITKNKHLSYMQAPQLSSSNLHIRNQQHNSIHANSSLPWISTLFLLSKFFSPHCCNKTCLTLPFEFWW